MKRTWYAAIVVAVIGLIAAVVAFTAGDDDDQDGSASGTTTTSTSSVSSSTTSTSEPAPDQSEAVVLWPLRGSDDSFDSPTDAARSFAVDFLEFEAPVIGEFQQGDSRSGEVPIRPRSNGPVTTVLVRQVGAGDSWSVLAAVTDNIEVTGPEPGAVISSPVTVTGRAHTFEGNVNVEVRQDEPRGVIGEGFVTGGGDEMRPFDGRISFETPGTRYGALVFLSRSAENGQVWEATVIRVAFRSTDADVASCGSYRSTRPELAEGQMEVTAYAVCDAPGSAGVAVHPVFRAVPKSPAVLRASLEALLAGVTAAERAGSLGSWFSEETAGMLKGVTITDGHAVVDFDDLRPVIPNASSSAGSERLLAQLDATVFQFRSVESVEYRINGDCEAFNEWLQFGGCDRRTRPASSD
jgi:hypothetical protein